MESTKHQPNYQILLQIFKWRLKKGQGTKYIIADVREIYENASKFYIYYVLLTIAKPLTAKPRKVLIQIKKYEYTEHMHVYLYTET